MAKSQSLFAHLILFILTVLFSARAGIILIDFAKFIKLGIFLIIWYAMIIAILAGYKNRNNAYPALTLLYSLNLFNLILIIDLAVYKPISYTFAIVFSVLGIFAAALYASKIKKVKYLQFPLDLTESTEALKKPETVEQTEQPKTKVTKTFAPARFMASKTGEKFHSPKCNWAKKISKTNLIWLKDKEEAKQKGFKRCGLCVK